MRLDLFLVQRGYCRSRDRAKALVEAGDCTVNGQTVTKPAHNVTENDTIELINPDFSYVSRGGLKLAAALDTFDLPVKGKTVLDVGVATGGFTDCLLQRGAAKVYAVDVGKGQLASEIQQNKRVIFLPNTDARHLQADTLPERPDLVVVDVSFLSVTALLAALYTVAGAETVFVFLIKPQFETGKPHKGVLWDKDIVEKALKKVREAFHAAGYEILAEMESPVTGKEGNREFLWHARLL